jgi:hypothetical protein
MLSLSQLICAIVFLAFILYLLVEQIKSILRLRWTYLTSLWSYLDLTLIVSSLCSFAMMVWKYVESKHVAGVFTETNGYAYVNLQALVYITDLERIFLAIACFVCCLKPLRLCRFHRRLCFFGHTLRHAHPALISFSLMFSLVFIAFLCLFHFLFLADLQSCSSLLATSQMLFEMTLMKFDARELIESQPVLGPLTFALFILLVVFICMSMFLTIIGESFRYVRDHPFLQSSSVNQDTFAYMYERIRRLLACGQRKQHDRRMRMKYNDPIEHFPHKVDQLLNALSQVMICTQVERNGVVHASLSLSVCFSCNTRVNS